LALWDALGTHDPLPLFGYQEADEPAVSLRPLSLEQEVVADYQTAGLSLRAHPLSLVREDLDRLRVTPASRLAGLADGRYVRVAGLVLVRQRPGTASGITFVTLEDETGIANLIVRPAVWERHRRAARTAQALLAHGRLERQDDVIHILVGRLEDLSDLLADIGSQSRDFR
jgi:error-prone DNA polymerase